MCILYIHMGVSKNSGTPKSSILISFSIINHPFWGTTIFGNIHIYKWLYTNGSFLCCILTGRLYASTRFPPEGFNPARFPVEIPQGNSWEARKHGCMCPSCSSETTSGKSLLKNTRVLIVIFLNVRHDLIYHDIANSSNLFLAWDHRSCNHCWLALSRWRPPPGSQCLDLVTWSVWYESFKRFQSKLHIESIKKIQRSVVVSKSESRVAEKTGDSDLMDLGGFYFQMFHDTFDFGPGFWSLLRSSWCNQLSVGYGLHPRMPVTTRIVTFF